MQFIPQVDYDKFTAFVENHPTKSHFMQSAAWGEFNRTQHGTPVHRVGLLGDDGELKAAALLLEKKPTLFPPYLYSPRGFVADFSDEALIAEFTAAIRDFAKKQGFMFLALDPDIERREIAADGSALEGGFDNSSLIDMMTSLGYRHRGFNLGFEGREPRFTFRIPLVDERKVIEKRFTGNVLKNIKKSHNYAVRFYEGSGADIPVFYEMISRTAERDRFYAFSLDYYQDFYDTLARDGMAHLYLGAVDAPKTLEMLKQALADTLQKRPTIKKAGPLEENHLTEQRLLREIELFTTYAEQYPTEVVVSAHLVVRYGGKSWAVHAGSSGIMNETFVNNRVYYEKLMAQKDAGCVFMDQFGTIGNPTEEGPFRTVHEFKRQWGGRYIEFVGQFDLVFRPVWYTLYEKVRPAYRRFRMSLKRLARKLKGGQV